MAEEMIFRKVIFGLGILFWIIFCIWSRRILKKMDENRRRVLEQHGLKGVADEIAVRIKGEKIIVG